MNREPDSFTVRCAMLRHAEMPKEPRRVPTVETGSLTAHQDTASRVGSFFLSLLFFLTAWSPSKSPWFHAAFRSPPSPLAPCSLLPSARDRTSRLLHRYDSVVVHRIPRCRYLQTRFAERWGDSPHL